MVNTAQASERAAARIRSLNKPTHADYEQIINEEYEKEQMATLINRRMFWALNHKIVPCFVVAHDLETAKVTVLLDNGGRHEADAYDVRATEGEARGRMGEIRENYNLMIYMAETYPNI